MLHLVFLLLLPATPQDEQLKALALVARKLKDPDASLEHARLCAISLVHAKRDQRCGRLLPPNAVGLFFVAFLLRHKSVGVF